MERNKKLLFHQTISYTQISAAFSREKKSNFGKYSTSATKISTLHSL
jgi:hypothetical protein